MGPGYYTQSFPLLLETDKPVTIYYFQVGGQQQPPQQIAFQTLHNSFLLMSSLGDTLLSEGINPFYNNIIYSVNGVTLVITRKSLGSFF